MARVIPLRSQWTYLYASIPIFQKDWKKAIQEQKMALEFERGFAPRVHGVDTYQLKLSAEFRILWAHLLLNDFDAHQVVGRRTGDDAGLDLETFTQQLHPAPCRDRVVGRQHHAGQRAADIGAFQNGIDAIGAE